MSWEGRVHTVYVWGPPSGRWAASAGRVYRSVATTARTREAEHRLVAPMPSMVLKVLAQPGARVARGEILVLLEAMKMEMAISAPADATIAAVHCREGERVQPDTVLVEFESE